MTVSLRLLFVYNADGGLFNTLADIGHKLFSPQTYECRLCALTHGIFTERKEWRDFLEDLPVECSFLHRDEFHKRYPGIDQPLPAVFRLSNEAPTVCLDADILSRCSNLGELQSKIRQHCLIAHQITANGSK